MPNADYAGRTDDDSSAVAVTLRDGKAVAYFCDGRDQESWLKGDVEADGSMRLTGQDGNVLTGELKGKRIRGTVDMGQREYGFTADKALKPSGLYRATATVRGAEGRRRLDRPAERPAGRHPQPRGQAGPRTPDRPRDRCRHGRRTATHGQARDPVIPAPVPPLHPALRSSLRPLPHDPVTAGSRP